MPQQGDMWFRIMFDHRKAVAGMKLTGRELQELRVLAGDLAGGLGKLVPEFDKLTRLARVDGDHMKVVAGSFAKVALQTKENTAAAAAFIKQLRQEVVLLKRKQAAGEKLTEQQKTMLTQNERIAKQFETALEKGTAGIKKQTTAMSAMQKQLVAIGKNIGFISAAYRAYGFAIDSVTAAMEQQRSQKAFEVFTGSEAIAKQLISDVRAFAGRTPLTFAASQQSVRTLLQYGVTTSKVTTVLEQLGDVSGGSTEQLQRLSLAFGQITANGRLQGQELRQLIEAGFNPLSVIAEKTGKSMFQLKTEMAAGAVSADMIADALQSATSEGGRFNNMLDQIGKTPFGQIQILRGEIQKLQADMGAAPAFIGGGTAEAISNILRNTRATLKVIAMAGEDAVFYADLLAKSFENSNLILKPLGFALRSMAMAEQSFHDTRVQAEEQERDARKEALQDRAVEQIQALKIGRIYAKYGQEQVEHVRLLMDLRKEGLEEEAQSLELAKQEADEQERRLNAIKEASKEAKNAERAAKARRDAIVRQHEDPAVGLERQLSDLFRMERMGMFADAPGVVTAEKERLTKDFIEAKVNQIVESQKEAAQVATKGSKEEFQIMRDIAMKNADSADSREEKRHKARMEAQEALKNAVEALPEEISSLLPQAVAG